MTAPRVSSPSTANSRKLPAAQVVGRHAANLLHYQSERPPGADESARIWCHRSLAGVELFRGSYKSYQAARHFHTVPAIGIVARGSMSSYCRGATHNLPTGTVFLINPEEVHAPGPALSNGWVLQAFYFDNLVYCERSRNFSLSALRFSQLFIRDPQLTRKLLSLHRALEHDISALAVESALLPVFRLIAKRYSSGTYRSFAPKPNSERIRRVREYLDAHYERNITLDELANLAEFSPFHLLRTFRNSVRLTPRAYLTQVRVEAAKSFLRFGRTISHVALETGFTDQSHFTRHFKRITGLTPGQYFPRIETPKAARSETDEWKL